MIQLITYFCIAMFLPLYRDALLRDAAYRGACQALWLFCLRLGGFVLFLVVVQFLGEFPFAILWSIWKERSNRIFKRVKMDFNDLHSIVNWRLAKWAIIGEEFANLRLDDCIIGRIVFIVDCLE